MFVDFKAAFDSDHRLSLWRILWWYCILDRIIISSKTPTRQGESWLRSDILVPRGYRSETRELR